MLKTSPQLEAVPHQLAEVMTVILKTDPKKGPRLFGRLRIRATEEMIASCLQLLGTRELDGTGRQIAAWLSTVGDYGSPLLDPAFLTIEQAKQTAKVMRATDPQFALKMLKSLPEESSPDVMRRALLLLDATREGEPVSSS